jgi:hypothetical protein
MVEADSLKSSNVAMSHVAMLPFATLWSNAMENHDIPILAKAILFRSASFILTTKKGNLYDVMSVQ